MKEDVIKFRKTCDILIKNKGYNKNRIVTESGISWPTFQKILVTPIDELHIQASVLGLVQDFNRKHCEDFNYANADPIPGTVEQNKKQSKPEKDNAIPIADVIVPEKKTRGKSLYSKKQLQEDLTKKEKINIKDSNTVQIIVFLKMKATEYRELADDFDKVANSFLNR